MKRKNFRLSLASLVVFLLVGVMCASSALMSLTSGTIATIGSTNSAISVGADDNNVKLTDLLDSDKYTSIGKVHSSDDTVSLIVTMNDTTLVDMWLANPQGYSRFSDYRKSIIGRNAAENLIKKQNALYNKIARSANVTLKYNYVNVMNGFAIEIKYGDREAIDAIAYKANVKNTVLATHYDTPKIDAVENEVTAYETGIFDSEESIYGRGIAGQGTVAAVLDTGIDWEHIAFSPEHPLFQKEEQLANDTLRFDKDDIKELLEMPNGLLTTVRTRQPKKGDPYSQKVTVDDLYKNEKIVFGFDYADRDTEVNTDVDNAHGTHVAGIIAGHSDTPYEDKDGNYYLKGKDGDTYKDAYGEFAGKFYTRDESGKLVINDKVVEVGSLDSEEAKSQEAAGKIPVVAIYDKNTKKQITGITGVAPQSQLAIFKVFGDYESGANSETLYAALEDCVTLGVDSINMSLGTDCGFQEDTGAMDSAYEIYEKVGKTGISLVCAASNSYSAGFNSHYGLNLISNPDSATVGSPASYDAAFAVASISGVKTKYLSAVALSNDANKEIKEEYGVAYYQEAAHVNGEAYDFMEDLFNAVRIKKLDKEYIAKAEDGHEILKIPYVTILGTGDTINYSGKDVTNKIALVQRGVTSFEDKIKIAQQHGALACIIFNNAAGIIRMQVGDDIKHDELGEDGEKINFPACSITMDAAAPIRDRDISASGVVPSFIFDPQAEAGPFMSDFSSWGPLPNLLLKPEITAHGGDIYSSIPGNETAYARFSGTSMACPNTAGVVTLMRSYMIQEGNPEKFDLWSYEYKKDADGNVVLDKNGNRVYELDAQGNKKPLLNEKGEKYIDYNVLEQRIYQILMSTTTIAKDELGNPYSPRRQGSGLADLNRSETTDQYIFVKDDEGNETERTKIELLDDPEKNGVYEMKFYVRNVGNEDAEYSITADVMTEGKSSDKKTVNEKAELLNYTAELKVDGQSADVNSKIKVPAKKTVEIIYKVNLDSSAKTYLDSFPNGMYVDGFVRLVNTKTDGINLNVPYLAFYGDWSEAPIMDYDIFETSADLHDDNIDDDYKRYAGTMPTQLLGKFMQEDTEYIMGLGQLAFMVDEDYFDEPDAEEDKCALSYNEDSALFNIYCVGGFLRGAKKLFYRVTDVVTGEVLKENVYFSARKSAGAGGIGGAWIDINIKDLKLANNAQYQLSIYPVIDWHAEDYPSSFEEGSLDQVKHEDIETSINKIISEGEAWNEAHANDGRAKRYSWSCKFWIDSDSPFISDTQVRVERDKSGNPTYYLDMYLTDNHYISALGMYMYNKDEAQFKSVFGDGMCPLDTDRNTTTLVSYDITNIWDQINEGLLLRMQDPAQSEKDAKGKNYTEVRIMMFDYAMNSAWYTIDLYELLKADIHTDVLIGDTGNYRTYRADGKEDVTVLMSTNREIATDADGNYKTIDTLTLVPGQRVSLKNAIISVPSSAWRDELKFTVSPNDIIRFDEDTYELYALEQKDGDFQRATATLTITSRVNSTLNRVLTVYVLTNQEVKDYKINTSNLVADKALSGISFEDGNYKVFNAGEEYIVQANPEPWFVDFDSTNYFIGWRSGIDLIATVEPLKPNDPEYTADPKTGPLKARIKANAAPRDKDGRYIEGFDENGEPLKDKDGNIKYVDYKKNNFGDVMITAEIYKVITKEEYDKKNDGRNKNLLIDPATGRYGEAINVSALFGASVQEEFVVTGNTLSEYHGVGGNVVIPDNLNITIIGSMLWLRRNDITSITFPEGLETISRAACAYMTKLERVKLPSTLQTIGEYAFTASYELDGDGPDTRLMVVDTSACKRPIKAAKYAFSMQRYIGVNLDESEIIDVEDSLRPDAEKVNKIVLLDEETRALFQTKMVRLAGDYSFYGMRFVSGFDLSGLKSAGVAAFYEYGAGFSKYDELGECTATFGPDTMMGLVAFASNGIKKLVLPMRRVNEQMFFGSTIISTISSETSTVDGIYGALEEIEFTADNVIIEAAGFVYTTVKKVTFKGSVDTIGEAAFYSCRNLEKVTFNSTCREIGVQAFADTALTSITLPAGLENLGAGAFANCQSLTTVKIDEGCTLTPSDFSSSETVSTTEGAPFMGCTKLEEFTTDGEDGKVNDTLSIVNGVLYAENGKRLVCVPAGYKKNINDIFKQVTTIGAYALGGVTFNINTSIDLSDTDVEKIEEGAFYYSNISSITLNEKIKEIGDAAFLGCSSLTSVNFGDNSNVTRIGAYAFYVPYTGSNEVGSLASIKLPASLTEIGEFAFAYQFMMTEVEFLGDKVTKIDNAVFLADLSLAKISMYDSTTNKIAENTLFVESIGADGLANTSLTTIRLPNVKRLEAEAFLACNLLEDIYMPNVTYIGEKAFGIFDNPQSGMAATSLKEVVLNDEGQSPKLEEIDVEAFRDVTTLTSINLSSVKKIGDNAFKGSGVKDIVSLDKIETIGDFSFEDSAVATTNGGNTFKLSTSLTEVGMGAFAGSKIGAFEVESGSAYFADNGVLYKKTANGKYELVAYPSAKSDEEYSVLDNTVRINAFAFMKSRNLKTVNIAASVTNIGDGAFYNSNVTEYKFNGLEAPILEASQDHIKTEYRDAYWWQLYRNFKGSFTYNRDGDTNYKYNPIRQSDETDVIGDDVHDADDENVLISKDLINTSYVKDGGYNKNVSFGITLYYPSNATGFNSFIWEHYFDQIEQTAEVEEPAVAALEEMIRNLPDPDKVTASDKNAIEDARSAYKRLSSDAQRDFVDKDLVSKLEACERALEALGPIEQSTYTEVSNMIDALPLPENITLDNKADVEAARRAYNSLSDSDKSRITEAQLKKLEDCEAAIEALEGEKNGCGCSGCGTITYGDGNGGNGFGGLMIGALIALALILVLLPLGKKRRNVK